MYLFLVVAEDWLLGLHEDNHVPTDAVTRVHPTVQLLHLEKHTATQHSTIRLGPRSCLPPLDMRGANEGSLREGMAR